MERIDIAAGLDLSIRGVPSAELETAADPGKVAAIPEKIPFIKPKLAVREGDAVRRGSLLFTDKGCPEIRFLSPGCGRIEDIQYGPRRIIQKIVIDLADSEKSESFESFTGEQLASADRSSLVAALLRGGQWPFFRELPYHNIPEPETLPPMIVVCLDRSDPFAPQPEIYLKDKEDLFRFGLTILEKLTDRVLVSVSAMAAADGDISALATHICSGPFPAGDPAALVYRVKKGPEENRAWYIQGQDLISLAELMMTGRYPVQRIFAVGGEQSAKRLHICARAGYPVAGLLAGRMADSRLIAGGLLCGYSVAADSFMGIYETSLVALPDGGTDELFGFMRSGFSKMSASRTFLSRFNGNPLSVDCGLHGEERACINCGYCAPVCPVDISPQFLMKNVLADEIDEALALGLLDCVACGLCTFVCPSKIDLAGTFMQARMAYRKEMG